MEDFAKSLAFEIKKEIADRYFGFRKVIEEDTNEYQKEVITSALSLETDIGFDLLRIYALLHDNSLIHRFYNLTGLGEVLFFDSYVTSSPTIRKRLFASQKIRGFLKKSRTKNMFFDTYDTLHAHVHSYRARLAALIEEREVIAEEIKLFYKKNDIDGIMLFLRDLDAGANTQSSMAGAINRNNGAGVAEKMRLTPPDPVEKLLPTLPEIPSKTSIRHELDKLINEAIKLQPKFDLKDL